MAKSNKQLVFECIATAGRDLSTEEIAVQTGMTQTQARKACYNLTEGKPFVETMHPRMVNPRWIIVVRPDLPSFPHANFGGTDANGVPLRKPQKRVRYRLKKRPSRAVIAPQEPSYPPCELAAVWHDPVQVPRIAGA